MEDRDKVPDKLANLRQRAEEVLHSLGPLSPVGMREVLDEICIHQIELALQNDELLRTQAELDASRSRYFELFNMAPVGYCLVARGRIREINQKAGELLGETPGRLIHALITRFIHPEDQDIFYFGHRRLLETGEPIVCDLRMVKLDGTVFWVHLEAGVAPNGELGPGKGPLIRLVMSDMTSYRLAEAELAARESLVQRRKELERMGVLASGVAHDFNNLLTTILGNANLGSIIEGKDGKHASHFAAIETASLRAADLTYQLLAFTGKNRCLKTEVDANLVVTELAAAFVQCIPENVTLHCDLADRLPYVKGDLTHLSQLVDHLLKNASECGAPDRVDDITIRTRAEGLVEAATKGDEWIVPLLPGRYATIEVSDRGTGMSPELVARAFEPFYSTKFIGRGLGLAAATGILRSHGGGMTLRSEPGRGSTFKVFLPAMTEARTTFAAAPAPFWKGNGEVLIVDDEAPEIAKFRHLTKESGLAVMEAHVGEEGLEAFRLHHGHLALVLADPGMPPQGGLAAFEELQAIDPAVPMVLCRRFDAPSLDGLPMGMVGTLTKPFRAAEVQGLLARAFA